MTRTLRALAIAAVAIVACLGLIALLASRDSSHIGGAEGPGVEEPDRGARHVDGPRTPASPPGEPPTSGPHRPEPVERDGVALSDDQLLEALHLGNVVILYDGDRPPAALEALQTDVAGAFDPELAAAGQAVILAPRPGIGEVTALAWGRKLVASGADDPQLREFAETWLGQAPR